ncbi:hypothetical protein IV102_19960 [bacterium]|nr:hypothetical protein [bacterium]
MIRIAFYGNLCNNLFQICCGLRNFSSVDAHLFIDGGLGDLQQMPENDDHQLKRGYPHWIHPIPSTDPVKLLLAPWRAPLLKHLDNFDALVVSGYGPMLAQFTRIPSFFLTAGGDLTQWPFPFRYPRLYPAWRHRLGQVFRGLWQRRGIRHCEEVWTQPFGPFQNALEHLSIAREKISLQYFPLMLDTQKFSLLPLENLSGQARWLRLAHDFVIFHPSRLMILDDKERQHTGDWKANDRLIRGFAKFRRQTPHLRSVLALIHRPASRDMQIARELIRQLQIEDGVVWLRPTRSFGFSREELVELYSASDVVADDFGAGWFGSIVVEALSIGRPVVTYVDEQVMSQLYPYHPLVNARLPDEIAAALVHLSQQPHLRQELGLKGRQWVEEFHSYDGAGKIYSRRFDELAHRLGRLKKVTQPPFKAQ